MTTVLRTIARELLGLFVDDWAFALLLVAWVALFATLGRLLPGAWEGVLFFAGLAVLTLAFIVRAASRVRARS